MSNQESPASHKLAGLFHWLQSKRMRRHRLAACRFWLQNQTRVGHTGLVHPYTIASLAAKNRDCEEFVLQFGLPHLKIESHHKPHAARPNWDILPPAHDACPRIDGSNGCPI